jgi:hypothetical protein
MALAGVECTIRKSKKRRLSDTVATYEAHDLTGRYLEIDARKNRSPAQFHGQALEA